MKTLNQSHYFKKKIILKLFSYQNNITNYRNSFLRNVLSTLFGV